MSSDHDYGHDHSHDHSSCADHTHGPTPYTQTLDELDFQRSLHSACAQNDLARARQILEKKGGRAADERDANGYTPLHYAARTGDISLCRLLLSHYPDVNARTSSLLATPLHRAASQGHLAVVRLLLASGADASLRDADGRTAEERAKEAGFEEVAGEIAEGGKKRQDGVKRG